MSHSTSNVGAPGTVAGREASNQMSNKQLVTDGLRGSVSEASHNLSLTPKEKAHSEMAVEDTDNSISQVLTATARLMDSTEALMDFATARLNSKAGEDKVAEENMTPSQVLQGPPPPKTSPKS